MLELAADRRAHFDYAGRGQQAEGFARHMQMPADMPNFISSLLLSCDLCAPYGQKKQQGLGASPAEIAMVALCPLCIYMYRFVFIIILAVPGGNTNTLVKGVHGIKVICLF